MFGRIRKYLSTLTVLALLTTNVLVLVHDATNALLSSAMVSITQPFVALIGSANELVTVRDRQNKTITRLQMDLQESKLNPKLNARQRQVAKKVSDNIKVRTVKRAAASTGAILAESVPYLGIAAILAETGYEVVGYCETFNDMNELYESLGLNRPMDESAITKVCNPELPSLWGIWTTVSANRPRPGWGVDQ
ncbi:MAG: hypothetical protein P8O79_07105 [Halieaceae bacterium]|nr:hypothetical protein [Halieaceae bacterium]